MPIPSLFRRALVNTGASGVVATPLDQCLALYPPDEWERLEAQLARLPAFSKPVKALTRLLTARAADCALDVQGRILLPPALRAVAGLGREATLVGVLNRIEVWPPEAWRAFVSDSERLLDDVSLDVEWPPAPGPQPTRARPPRPQGKPSR